MRPFTAALPPLYCSADARAFAYAPEAREQELSMAGVLSCGGTLVYTARPPGSAGLFLDQLSQLLRDVERPGVLYLDNPTENHRHWNQQALYCASGLFRTAGRLRFGQYRLSVARGAKLTAGESEAAVSPVSFGRGGMAHRGGAALQWNGIFHMEMPLYGWLGAGLTYYSDVYDELTRQNLLCPVQADALAEDDTIMLQAELSLLAPAECVFQFPAGAALRWNALPPMHALSFALRFARGDGGYSLVPSGSARLDADGPFGGTPHGVFRGKRGDRIWFIQGQPAHITRPAAPVEVSALGSSALYDAGGPPVVLADKVGLPYSTPATASFDEALAERARRAAEQPQNRFAAGEGFRMERAGFPVCIQDGRVRWLRFAETQSMQPGMALCDPSPELAICMASPELFLVLCGENLGGFATPYALTDSIVDKAVARGYPARDAQKLKLRYPDGAVFLSLESFRNAVRAAGAEPGDALEAEADQYSFTVGERVCSLNPNGWERNGTMLIIKGSAGKTVRELIEDPGQWSFPPASAGEVRASLLKIAEEAARSPVDPAFYQASWRGALAVRCPSEGGLLRGAVFSIGETEPVCWP